MKVYFGNIEFGDFMGGPVALIHMAEIVADVDTDEQLDQLIDTYEHYGYEYVIPKYFNGTVYHTKEAVK
jgi:methyl coenzyme M reductase alpha subunit